MPWPQGRTKIVFEEAWAKEDYSKGESETEFQLPTGLLFFLIS